ncbi:MAG TPA: hypothetical protein DEQ84_04115 [Prevotellaceae bacterium]|nr:hypothetical protein [Prevotellaceae bacterium]
MFKFRNHLAAVFLLLSMATATAQTQSLPRVTLMFKNGQSIRLCLPSRNWKPSLPCSLADPATQELAQYPDTVISSISLDAGESPINGCSRWEACHIATPSLIFGKEHTELRLIGVVATSAGRGTVYRWFLPSRRSPQDATAAWYGIRPEGSSTVYPFIQDGQLWLRDLPMAFGKTHPEFVSAVKNYYQKGKRSEKESRIRHLLESPADILLRF